MCAHFALFVPFVEIQNVRLLNSFRSKAKSLAIWRFCSTFAVEFAVKNRPPRESPYWEDESTLLYIIIREGERTDIVAALHGNVPQQR